NVDLALHRDVAAIHALGLARHRKRIPAALVQRDQSADAVLLVGQLGNRVLRCPLHGGLLVEHAGDDVVGDRVPDEQFARPGAGDAAGPVVGVGAGADDGRVPHAAGELVHQPPGRGPGGEVPLLVHGDRADGPEILIGTAAAPPLLAPGPFLLFL